MSMKKPPGAGNTGAGGGRKLVFSDEWIRCSALLCSALLCQADAWIAVVPCSATARRNEKMDASSGVRAEPDTTFTPLCGVFAQASPASIRGGIGKRSDDTERVINMVFMQKKMIINISQKKKKANRFQKKANTFFYPRRTIRTRCVPALLGARIRGPR